MYSHHQSCWKLCSIFIQNEKLAKKFVFLTTATPSQQQGCEVALLTAECKYYTTCFATWSVSKLVVRLISYITDWLTEELAVLSRELNFASAPPKIPTANSSCSGEWPKEITGQTGRTSQNQGGRRHLQSPCELPHTGTQGYQKPKAGWVPLWMYCCSETWMEL